MIPSKIYKFLLLLVAVFLTACPGIVPGSRYYIPGNEVEKDFLLKARRDIFPDDVKKSLSESQKTLVAWTGVVKKASWVNQEEKTAKFIVKHHYWHWVEDHSIQREVVFLSPRGEGYFTCIKQTTSEKAVLPEFNSFAITYGFPKEVDANGRIKLDCQFIVFFDKKFYGTDIWEYGRDFILSGDKNDLKVLRVPLF